MFARVNVPLRPCHAPARLEHGLRFILTTPQPLQRLSQPLAAGLAAIEGIDGSPLLSGRQP